MKLKSTVDEFFFDMIVNELKLMNSDKLDTNITYNSLLYLDLISHKKNCTVSYIADILHVSKSAVTIKVNELEQIGLIKKIQSTEDRRVYHLIKTDKAEKMYRIYDTAFDDAIKYINKNYSNGDVEIFCKILKTFSNCFKNKVKLGSYYE